MRCKEPACVERPYCARAFGEDKDVGTYMKAGRVCTKFKARDRGWYPAKEIQWFLENC